MGYKKLFKTVLCAIAITAFAVVHIQAQVAPGLYYLVCKINGKYVEADLNTGGVFVAVPHKGDSQQWLLCPGPDDYFYLALKLNGKFLDQDLNNSRMQVMDGNAGTAQQWRVVGRQGDNLVIESRANGKVWDQEMGTGRLLAYPRHNGDNQQFVLVRVGQEGKPKPTPQPIPNPTPTPTPTPNPTPKPVAVEPSVRTATGFASHSQKGEYTSWDEKWKLPEAGRGIIQFTVQAKADVHLALSEVASTHDPMYEIVLGGWNNTKSVVRRRSQGPEVASAPAALRKPGVADAYWIICDGSKNKLSIGYGNTPGQNVLLECTDNNFLKNVRYWAVSSWESSAVYADFKATALPPEVDPNAPFVKPTKASYSRYEEVTIDYGNFSGHNQDYVGVVPVGTPDGEWTTDYSYTYGKREGRISMRILRTGRYEVRGYLGANNSKVVCRATITITE